MESNIQKILYLIKLYILLLFLVTNVLKYILYDVILYYCDLLTSYIQQINKY